MYVGRNRGYDSDAIQVVTGLIDYIPTNNIGNNNSTSLVTGVLDYVVLNRMGYYNDVEQTSSSILDYLITPDWGYYRNVVNIDTGILDYLIDNVPFNIIIEQERGWSFNWELINVLWETIDDNWEG